MRNVPPNDLRGVEAYLMSTSIEQLKTTLSALPETQRQELATYLLGSLDGASAERGAAWRSFFQGMGSALEFFPPPDRLNAWRMTPDVPLDEWPKIVRGLFADLQQDAKTQGNRP